MTAGEPLSDHALQRAALPPQTRQALDALRAELEGAYRDRFSEMTEVMRRQASTIARMAHTLDRLLQALEPQLKSRVPAMRYAEDGSIADLTSSHIADPIGLGYLYSPHDFAAALRCNVVDVATVMKELDFSSNQQLAIVVRQGNGDRRPVVNYHRRALDYLAELVENPPTVLSKTARSALRRMRQKRTGQGSPPPRMPR